MKMKKPMNIFAGFLKHTLHAVTAHFVNFSSVSNKIWDSIQIKAYLTLGHINFKCPRKNKIQVSIYFGLRIWAIQLRSYKTAVEHVYEEKWGHFDRAKFTFKMLLASWNFYIVLKGFRSFNAKNLNYVG